MKQSELRSTLNFIGGQFVPAASGRTFENRSPVDGSLVSLVAEAGEPEVDAAVQAARAALKGPWGKMTLQERTELLHAVADEISRRFDDFLQAEIADTGKPVSLASHIDIPRGAANFEIFADVVKNVPGEYFEMATPDGKGALNYAIRTPKGVIGVICPWNLPLLLMTWKVAPALACGNTVVVKPSEETPGTATLLGEVMNAVGVPTGVYNVVHGFGPSSAGELLTRHPGSNAITFTGETRTGEAIMRAAATGVRPVSFELGGKNAGIVFADCDFDSRHRWHRPGGLRQLRAGVPRAPSASTWSDPSSIASSPASRPTLSGSSQDGPRRTSTNLGPLISQEHRRKVLSYYEKAKAEGATIVTGGGVPEMPGELAQGCWIQPTIWTGLPETSAGDP